MKPDDAPVEELSMANHVLPLFSVEKVNSAARALVAAEQAGHSPDPSSLSIVNNWRSAHDYPLNSIHMTVKGRAKRVAGPATVLTAQRIKRLESIMLKLHDRESMKLSQMQDIGGCRIILPSLEQVFALQKMYLESPVVHEALRPKDYIAEPADDSGYRSLHLKFRFAGRGTSQPWNGLKIEMQVRTALQHQWATAVEAAGTMMGQALKSRRGDPDWLRFFKLVSSAFAVKEQTPMVPGTPSVWGEMVSEMREIDARHHILATLGQYATLIPSIEKKKNAHYYVLKMNPIQQRIEIFEFQKEEAAVSAEFLARMEQTFPPPIQVVRVAVSSVKALKRAYPNYFFDTGLFVKAVRSVLGERRRLISASTATVA